MVTPIDEYVQKGAKTSFEDVRGHCYVVAGYAPVPVVPGRVFVLRIARLAQGDFDKFGYTENCPVCEFFQIGIGARQNHSDFCRARIENKNAVQDR